MANLLNVALTAAVAPGTATNPVPVNAQPRSVTIQANFTYGSGGTSVTAYVQTSLDLGSTWIDIACFSFTTSSARKVFNLTSRTPQTTELTPTDGSMTADTSQDGLLGSKFRVKYGSVGTYAGGTVLAIDIQSDQLGPWS
jgi:hypothetical protein